MWQCGIRKGRSIIEPLSITERIIDESYKEIQDIIYGEVWLKRAKDLYSTKKKKKKYWGSSVLTSGRLI